MYEIDVKPGLTFKEAEALLIEARRRKEDLRAGNMAMQTRNIHSGGLFDRWFEDEMKPKKPRKKTKRKASK